MQIDPNPAQIASQVPQGAAFYPVPFDGQTRAYGFILVPGFTLLAFSSALEPLRIANQLSQRPLYSWRILSENGGAVLCSAGVPVGVDAQIESLSKETRLFVCAGNPAMAATSGAVTAALARHYRHGGVVGGVCTGGFALVKAGLVTGRRFTVHWENRPSLIETFPGCTPTENRFEVDGRVLTCGGGAASTDMMLSIIAKDHGSDFSAMVAEMCLRTVMPNEGGQQRSSLAALMSSRNPVLIATVTMMMRHIEDPLPLDGLAKASGYSRRQIERMFQSAIGQTPGGFYRGLRLDRGRILLGTTDLSLTEIAVACGFASVAHFSKCFRDRFGTAPTKLKLAL